MATAYFAYSAALMSRAAAVLGCEDEAWHYAELADEVRAAWQAEFVWIDGSLVPDTQANHVRALAFDLVPRGLRAKVAERLVALIHAAGTHLGTGFLATPYLLPVLADTGHLDVAFALLLSDSVPSWLHMVDRGATTMWERWDGVRDDGTPFESLNHYSTGAVVSFLHRYVAGIQPLDDAPAYRRFRIAPRPGAGIEWARAIHLCPYGRIECSWKLTSGRLELTVEVPAGTTAELVLPDGTRQILPPGRHDRRSSLPAGAGVGAVRVP